MRGDQKNFGQGLPDFFKYPAGRKKPAGKIPGSLALSPHHTKKEITILFVRMVHFNVCVTTCPVTTCPARTLHGLPGNRRELYSRSPLLFR